MTNAQKRLVDCLRSFMDDGIFVVTAGMVAERLYPDCRSQNNNGQVFNLAAGSVGKQLRRCRCVHEFQNRRWTLIPEWFPSE